MDKYKRLLVIFLAAFMILAASGCRPQQRPEGEGPQLGNGKKPPIPEGISQGENQEPRLKVYITDTQEIKEMAFEEYLPGVLAGEMHNDWPEEALQAQAILARTFVMEFIQDKGGSKYEGAHVSTDIEEAQAWDASQINERIKAAVQATRGQVALHNNNYIKAWFHAHAGGQTAAAKEGLDFEGEEPPYIKVVASPDSEEAPPEDANWTATFTKQEILAALQKVGQSPGDFNSIEVAEKGPSGRATQLKIGNATVPAAGFRVALDSTKMKSTQLESITVSGNQVVMKGIGYGHGVGMSQWGAYQLAKDGKTPEEILKHYFKDIRIVKMW